MAWTASLRLEPTRSRFYERAAALFENLDGARMGGDEKEPVWEAELGIESYESFCEICRLSTGNARGS